jgi:hypothetical protein
MTFEVIEPSEIPRKLKALKENAAIYEAAKKLLSLGVGRAMRIKLEDVSSLRVRKKAHVYFRFRTYKLRTKEVDGYLYMWIEERQPKRFEVVGVPAKKVMAAHA